MACRLDKLSSLWQNSSMNGYHLLSPLALAFNTLQLFSNYFECMHRRFRGHTCATTHQLRPFPKDLFALQSAHIPVQWVYLENIILTTRRAAAAAAAAAASANANANFKEFRDIK